MRDTIVNELWSLYQTTEFAPLRGKAIGVLALIKPDNIIDSLIHDLAAKQSNVRGRAASALGRIGSEKALKPLITALSADKDSSVQERAASALGGIGSEKAVVPLKSALKDEGTFIGAKVKDIAFTALEHISRRSHKRILR